MTPLDRIHWRAVCVACSEANESGLPIEPAQFLSMEERVREIEQDEYHKLHEMDVQMQRDQSNRAALQAHEQIRQRG